VRAAFLLLLLGNLIFLAWWQGYLWPVGRDGREPQRLEAQVSPERIRVLKGTGEAAAASPVTATPTAPGAATVTGGPEVCRAVGALPLDDAEHVAAALAKAVPGISISKQPVHEAQSFWVHIPPLPNRQAAEKKSAEVKKRGFAEYYVVRDEGPNLNAVSLGLFGNRKAADEFVASLAKKGIRGARIQVRDKEPTQTKLELRGPADRLAAPVISELLKKAGTALGDCPAP
jgi:cell division septation protein DedD